MKYPALWAIRGYQLLISPLLPPSCRFYPSCSHYGYEAINRYGLVKGGAMAVWRVLRCNPWNDGGYDPVDPADRLRDEQEQAKQDRPASTSSAPTG